MELLILKSGSGYIRAKKNGFTVVGLDKASVFPMDQMAAVKEIKTRLGQGGFFGVCIKKLVLSEEDIEDIIDD